MYGLLAKWCRNRGLWFSYSETIERYKGFVISTETDVVKEVIDELLDWSKELDFYDALCDYNIIFNGLNAFIIFKNVSGASAEEILCKKTNLDVRTDSYRGKVCHAVVCHSSFYVMHVLEEAVLEEYGVAKANELPFILDEFFGIPKIKKFGKDMYGKQMYSVLLPNITFERRKF